METPKYFPRIHELSTVSLEFHARFEGRRDDDRFLLFFLHAKWGCRSLCDVTVCSKPGSCLLHIRHIISYVPKGAWASRGDKPRRVLQSNLERETALYNPVINPDFPTSKW